MLKTEYSLIEEEYVPERTKGVTNVMNNKSHQLFIKICTQH